MVVHRIVIDRSASPARILFSPTFNICGLFVDRHLQEGRAQKVVARGRNWTLSFGELHRAVCKMGNVLRSLGIEVRRSSDAVCKG